VGSLDRRLRTLEERGREPQRQPPGSAGTAEEIRAIDAEIARLEREMRAEGTDPYREPDGTWTNSAGHPTHTLDEHIAMLEAELEEEMGRCPGD
jgi:hypothetical protein